MKSVAALLRNKLAVFGVLLVLIVLFCAIFADTLAPFPPQAQNAYFRLQGPDQQHWFGTDMFGRDILSRVLHGARISLLVGVTALLLSTVSGTLLGIAAGLLRGKLEAVIMRTIDVIMCFPDLLLGLMIMGALGPGLDRVIGAIAVVFTPRFVRLAYGSTLIISNTEYVQAAKAIGVPLYRLILRHLSPNIIGEVLVVSTLGIGEAIRLEANLSFVGLGISPPTPSWGNMIREGVGFIRLAPWYSVYPGLAIMLAVLGFNMLGDGVRDMVDPRLRGVR